MRSALSVFAREDTLFGACYGIAEDFGFNPVWLRALFALFLFWTAPAAIAVYSALAALVAVSRWLVPEPVEAPADAVADAVSHDEAEPEWQADLPLAA